MGSETALAAAPCIALLVGVACGARPADPPAPTSNSQPPLAAAPQPPVRWDESYDLDGDGKNDRIVSEFTGGAHCCYRIGAELSSTGETTVFPFEMDGGYPGGLDLSQPDRFTVRTRPGGRPEIVYQIATYDGKPQPLDPAWTRRWKIHSHRVALCFAGRKPQARDDAPALPPCTR
jgi:hypothetical protein